MPKKDEILKELELDLDKRLQDLTKPKLVEMLQTLVTNLDKKTLSTLISDDKYFSLEQFVNWLEKMEKDVLMMVLNEPSSETDMRQPVAIWLRQKNLNVEFEVPISLGGKKRAIDVCGHKSGLLSVTICAVELKSDPKRGAIDKAFSQAKDNAKGADTSYIAFSPFVYLKNADVIMNKLESYEEVGLIIADRMRVVLEIDDPEISTYEDNIYNEVREFMESR